MLGLLFGMTFGILLQKGGATDYNVITGQILLTDFTVLKPMLSAVIVGMIGFHLLEHFGFVQSHAAGGSVGSNVIGGLIFGVGFALLGYCPGTVVGVVGTGALDALFGGMVGLLIGAGFFAEMYPWLRTRVLAWGRFPGVSVPKFLNLNLRDIICLMEVCMIGFLVLPEFQGL